MSEACAIIDFETRSPAQLSGKNGCGPWVYSENPDTQVLCLAYKLPGKKTKLWHRAHPKHGIKESKPPQDLFDWIEDGGLVEAHNAFFERAIWKNIMVARHGWPKIKHKQWRCTAARAAACSLPRALEAVAIVLNLDVKKDMEGNRIMQKCSRPRKPRKKEIEEFYLIRDEDEQMPILWNEELEDLEKTWDYCINDVETEAELADEIPELSAQELEIWQIDQEINERGIWCDRKMAEQALRLADMAVKELNRELKKITGIPRASQRAKLREWLSVEYNVDLPDTKGETLDEILDDEDHGLPKKAFRVIEIIRTVNRTSTAKYKSMLIRMSKKDDRIRDLLMYHGAHTGRWSGKGIQPQNFVRGALKDMEAACKEIAEGDYEWIKWLHGDVMEFLSFALRGALGATDGNELLVADFAAIEARVVMWLARASAALRVFERGEDIYCDMAGTIYNKKINKDDHPDERQMGKQSILGLGFGMGFVKFLITLWKYKIKLSRKQIKQIVPPSDYARLEKWVKGKEGRSQISRNKDVSIDTDLPNLVLTKYIVDLYRKKYPEIPALWKEQEQAAIAAVLSPGRKIRAGAVIWKVKKIGKSKFLCCKLPSGRILYYFKPQVSQKKTPWGMKETLSYMGIDSQSASKRFTRVFTYGGKLVENIVQAIARDLMAEAMLRLKRGHNDLLKLILTVHDELIAESKKGAVDPKEYGNVIAFVPKWAKGCPIDAEAKSMKRYRK